jgi:protein phosphatase
MGGHQAGEVASKVAAETISATLLDSLRRARRLQSPSRLVKRAIQKANAKIYKMASTNPQLSAMGTTLTLGLRLDNLLYLGHVGDSRAYLIRKGKMQQLTEDHSVVASLLKAGMITPEEAKTHVERGKIFRCLGVSPQVDIDVCNRLLRSGDGLVFCTDGLTNHIADNEILDGVEKGGNAYSTCQNLIHLANLRGGEDNISLIVVKIK